MVDAKTFIHRRLTPGDGYDIPDTLMTIWYYPSFKINYNLYDFRIDKVTVHSIVDGIVDELIVEQPDFDEDMSKETLEMAFEILVNEGIVEDLVGNHFRFSISKHI